MALQRYVALLRGINVGGRNAVPMADLRAAFEAAGHDAVQTYIQSGNVIFETHTPARELEHAIERALGTHLGVDLVVVVRSHRQLRSVVGSAPAGFGQRSDTHHFDTLFLKKPLTPAKAMNVVQLRDGVDRAWPGNGVVYFERLSAQRTKSRMNTIVGTPEYQLMTIRNWSTTTKLLALLEARTA